MNKKSLHAMCALVLVVILAFTPAVGVFAKTSISNSKYITIKNPSNESVWYKGDKIPVITIVSDIYEDSYTLPIIGIYRGSSDSFYDMFEGTDTVDRNSKGDGYGFYLDTTPYLTGRYKMICFGVAVSSKNSADGELTDSTPRACACINVKALAAPKSIRVKKNGGRATVTFKRSPGAVKYEVYRADSRKGTYRKIATTKSNKYTDTKAGASGHYYKIKAVRTKYGKVKSGFSKAAFR